MYVCQRCDKDFYAGPRGMVIGDDVICPHCGLHQGTDYDEPDLSHWTVKETSGPIEDAIKGVPGSS